MTNKLGEKIEVNRGVLWLLGGISPMMIIIAAFYLGSKNKDFESRIFNSPAQKEFILNKVQDPDYHMSYRDKVIQFMPRSEVEYKLNDIQGDLKEIKTALRIKQ